MNGRGLAVAFIVAFVAAVVFVLAQRSPAHVPSVPVVPSTEAGTEAGPRHCLSRALGYPCP